jgi:hypothetical protein
MPHYRLLVEAADAKKRRRRDDAAGLPIVGHPAAEAVDDWLPALSSGYRHSPREVFYAGGGYVVAVNGRKVTR